MISISDIYGFRKALSLAVDAVFTQEEIRTYTAMTPAEFQKARARVEAVPQMGASKGELYVGEGLGSRPGTTHELLRDGVCSLSVVSAAEAIIHEEICASVQFIAATMLTRVNPLLTFHEVMWFSDGGAVEQLHDPKQALFMTKYSYDIQLAIKPTALEAFLAQT